MVFLYLRNSSYFSQAAIFKSAFLFYLRVSAFICGWIRLIYIVVHFNSAVTHIKFIKRVYCSNVGLASFWETMAFNETPALAASIAITRFTSRSIRTLNSVYCCGDLYLPFYWFLQGDFCHRLAADQCFFIGNPRVVSVFSRHCQTKSPRGRKGVDIWRRTGGGNYCCVNF